MMIDRGQWTNLSRVPESHPFSFSKYMEFMTLLGCKDPHRPGFTSTSSSSFPKRSPLICALMILKSLNKASKME